MQRGGYVSCVPVECPPPPPQSCHVTPHASPIDRGRGQVPMGRSIPNFITTLSDHILSRSLNPYRFKGGGGQIIWSYRLFIKFWFRQGVTQKVEHILPTSWQWFNVGPRNHGLYGSGTQYHSELTGVVMRERGKELMSCDAARAVSCKVTLHGITNLKRWRSIISYVFVQIFGP